MRLPCFLTSTGRPGSSLPCCPRPRCSPAPPAQRGPRHPRGTTARLLATPVLEEALSFQLHVTSAATRGAWPPGQWPGSQGAGSGTTGQQVRPGEREGHCPAQTGPSKSRGRSPSWQGWRLSTSCRREEVWATARDLVPSPGGSRCCRKVGPTLGWRTTCWQGRACLSTLHLPSSPSWLPGAARVPPASCQSRWARAQGTPGPRRRHGPHAARAPPSELWAIPDPPRGQPYFPLRMRLFPLLRGGDRALRAWVRFRGLPGPLRAKLLWGSSRLSLKENHTLGCEPRGWRGCGERTHGAHTSLGATHTCRPATATS